MAKLWIVAYQSRGFGGRLIRWQTRSPYSHVAVVIHLGSKPILYESIQGKGVLRRDVTQADMEADWFLLDNHDERAIASAALWANSQLGKPYDWMMVIRFVTRRQETRSTRGKWFCSEYAFVIANKANDDQPILARTEPWEVAPHLCVRSPLLLACEPSFVLP